MTIDLETAHLRIVQAARDNLSSAIKRRGDLVQATVDSVSHLFALPAGADAGNSDSLASAVTNGAVRGAFEMGASLDSIAQGILLAAISGNADLPVPFFEIIRQTSRRTIRAVAGLDGDVEAAVHGLLDGAAQSANMRGLDREDAASAAGDGALLGAAQVHETKSEMVRTALAVPRESPAYQTDDDLVLA
jgi:hypothetical protein